MRPTLFVGRVRQSRATRKTWREYRRAHALSNVRCSKNERSDLLEVTARKRRDC